MRAVAQFSFVTLALVVGTLTPKLVAGSAYAVPDHRGLYARMEQRLQPSGYATEVVPHAFLTHMLVTREKCRALVAELRPDGTTLARLDLQAKDIGPGQVVYRGQYRAGIPPLVPSVTDRIQREIATFGFAFTREPVFYLAKTPECELDPADLAGFAIGTILRPRKLADK